MQLSADRRSPTTQIFPKLDEVFPKKKHSFILLKPWDRKTIENREVDNTVQRSKNEVRTVYINVCLKVLALFSSCIFC